MRCSLSPFSASRQPSSTCGAKNGEWRSYAADTGSAAASWRTSRLVRLKAGHYVLWTLLLLFASTFHFLLSSTFVPLRNRPASSTPAAALATSLPFGVLRAAGEDGAAAFLSLPPNAHVITPRAVGMTPGYLHPA